FPGQASSSGEENPLTSSRADAECSLRFAITLKLPSVSRTTASTSSRAACPSARTAARTSPLVTLSRFRESSKNFPRYSRRVGLPLIQLRNVAERTESQVMANCSATSKANASAPCAQVVDCDSSTVASVDPSATVTTKSKAFHFDSVRFPVTRSNSTSVVYASTPTTSVRTSTGQLSNSISAPDRFTSTARDDRWW